MISPWAALRDGISSRMRQWKNDPPLDQQGTNGYALRLADYYVKRTARETGEFIVCYFNHEDPRPHASGQPLFRKRIQSALLSVLVTKDDQGNRPALGPIAGSLGSSFAGAPLYRKHPGAEDVFRGASISYGNYFAKALYQEFRPDISFLIKRIVHHK